MHTNPEVLALLALGEDAGTPAERQHIDNCAACSQEVAELAGIADIGRSSSRPEALLSPSPEVWDRIRAELGFDITETVRTDTEPGLSPSVTSSGSVPSAGSVTELAARRRSAPPSMGTGSGSGAGAASGSGSSSGSGSGSGIGRRIASLAAAAVLALIVGIGVGINYEQRQVTPENRVIATAQLTATPKFPGATGTAEVTADGHGGRKLILKMSSPQPITGTVQVWLINPDDVEAPQPMGVMKDGVATIVIPPGMSLFQRPVVDISDEPVNDTDPTGHSGNSILRGALA
ncbi:MAG: anti-sigma factor [Propionibacteriaceae bacterium]